MNKGKALAEEAKTRIRDVATGQNINSAITIEDQIVALRAQLEEVVTALDLTPCEKFSTFQSHVAAKTKSGKQK